MQTNRRVALVTGASRGLGAVIARRLAADGFAVAVNHRDSADLAADVVASIQDSGGIAAAFAADVTDEQEVRRLVSEVEQQLGPIDTIVANATGPQPSISVEILTWQDIVEQMHFFVKSPTLLLNATVEGLKERGSGRFVHIASDVVDLVPAGSAAYVCAKTAQRSLARSWAKELGKYGITVNTVSPGWIPVERHAGIPAQVREQYADTVPRGRLGEPDDVAHAVSFLCSEGATHVTGTNINVNGGKTLD
jgi:NAD(P)-dependent dehydrogenase (short-subunit alcohol dehydrogenase family)